MEFLSIYRCFFSYFSSPSTLYNRVLEPQRIHNPPARQGLLFKPVNTTGDIARFILLFQGDQGLQRPNGQIYRPPRAGVVSFSFSFCSRGRNGWKRRMELDQRATPARPRPIAACHPAPSRQPVYALSQLLAVHRQLREHGHLLASPTLPRGQVVLSQGGRAVPPSQISVATRHRSCAMTRRS